MEIEEYRNIFENEERHFFYRSNHDLVLSTVADYRASRTLNVLDAGCGTGLLAKKLSKYGKVWGIDLSPEAIRFSKKRAVLVKQASVTKIPFKNNFFDVVTAIDVIYHLGVDDDTKALGEFHRVLKKGGVLIIRVPANKYLLSLHDRHVHTRERYSKDGLAAKLKKAGFKIEKISFVNATLFLPAVVKVLIEKTTSQNQSSSISKVDPFINQILLFLLSIENFLLKFVNLPFGIGLLAVAKKS